MGGEGSIIFATVLVRKRGKWRVNPFLRLYLFGGERVWSGERERRRQSFISESIVLHRRNMHLQGRGGGGGGREKENKNKESTLIPAVMTGRTLHSKKKYKKNK